VRRWSPCEEAAQQAGRGGWTVCYDGLSPLVLIPVRFEFRLDHWWLWLAEARGEGGAGFVETVHFRRNGRLCESPKAEKKSEDFHCHG